MFDNLAEPNRIPAFNFSQAKKENSRLLSQMRVIKSINDTATLQNLLIDIEDFISNCEKILQEDTEKKGNKYSLSTVKTIRGFISKWNQNSIKVYTKYHLLLERGSTMQPSFLRKVINVFRQKRDYTAEDQAKSLKPHKHQGSVFKSQKNPESSYQLFIRDYSENDLPIGSVEE